MLLDFDDSSLIPAHGSGGSMAGAAIKYSRSPASRLGETRTRLLEALSSDMSVREVETAVALIDKANRSLRSGPRFEGWRRALDDRAIRAAVVVALRSNPMLRQTLNNSHSYSVRDAIEATRSFNIGVDLTPVAKRARGEHLATAQRRVANSRVASCLASILNTHGEASALGALVRSRNAETSSAVDRHLLSLGELMVTEAGYLNVRLSSSPVPSTMVDTKEREALTRVLHTLCIEEPLVGEGMRSEIARSHCSPAHLRLLETLDLRWTPIDCALEAATPVETRAMALVCNQTLILV